MKELNVGGIFLAPMVGYLTAALLIYLLFVRRFLTRWEGQVWNPVLFRVAIFIILLTLLIIF